MNGPPAECLNFIFQNSWDITLTVTFFMQTEGSLGTTEFNDHVNLRITYVIFCISRMRHPRKIGLAQRKHTQADESYVRVSTLVHVYTNKSCALNAQISILVTARFSPLCGPTFKKDSRREYRHSAQPASGIPFRISAISKSLSESVIDSICSLASCFLIHRFLARYLLHYN